MIPPPLQAPETRSQETSAGQEQRESHVGPNQPTGQEPEVGEDEVVDVDVDVEEGTTTSMIEGVMVLDSVLLPP